MNQTEFLDRLKEKLSELNDCYYVGLGFGRDLDVRFRPKMKWELQDEHFKLWFDGRSVFMGFFDPAIEDPWGDGLVVFSLVQNQVSLPSGQFYLMGSHGLAMCFDLVVDQYKKALRFVEAFDPHSDDKLGDLDYLVSKWIQRPACVHLVNLVIERSHRVFVLQMGELLGVSDLVKSLMAARELTK